MDELAEGEVLAGRYVLGPALGHGAMGEVHLAEDIRLARPVAVKSLRPELARYPDVRQRFGQEARAAARISHPNVVRVYDSGEEDGIPFLVMECLPGSTLVDELAWGLLEPKRARQIGLDVLGALDAAHRLGIVHRDVKPGNILLSADLDGPVKVSDFGIAKTTGDGSLTDSGGLVGTASYLAPERVAGEPAGPASDLYSLGVVLYEALSGRKPYDGDTSLAVALAIHMGGAPSLVELRPDLDQALAAVVDRAIAQDPSDRWPSAAAMAEALHGFRPRRTGARPRREGAAAPVVAPVPAPTEVLPAENAASAAVEPTLLDAAPAATTPLDRVGAGDAAAASAAEGAPAATSPLPPVDDAPEGSGERATTSAASGDDRPAGPPVKTAALAATGDPWSRDRHQGVEDGWGREPRPIRKDPDAGDRAVLSRRRRVALLGGAAAASLLLILAVAGMGGSSSPEPEVPTPATPATTTAEVVAATVATTTTLPVTTATSAPPRSVATTRPPRQTVAPTTTAQPPTTRANTTTTAAPTTTRPTSSTAPPTSSTPTTPTTTGGLNATIPAA